MKIALLHGYGLYGSGSNLYVNRLSYYLCRQGLDVHVICQERGPSMPDHVVKVIDYDRTGRPCGQSAVSTSDLPGKTILHRPYLGEVLPVYNWDHYPGFPCVKTFLELSDEQLEAYISHHVNAVQHIVTTHGIDLIHANHVLAMPEVARRVSEKSGCAFVMTPHGSAIEYVARKQARYAEMSATGLSSSEGLIIGGMEMQQRIEDVWGQSLNIRDKIDIIAVGVDLSLFTPRKAAWKEVPKQLVSGLAGCSDHLMDVLFEEAVRTEDDAALLRVVETYRDKYEHRQADADLREKLSQVVWGQEKVVCFAGKLVVGKGVHVLISAMSKVPEARLVIVGEGSFREPLSLLLRAITRNDFDLFCRIVSLGWCFDHKPQQALSHLDPLCEQATFETFSAAAEADGLARRVMFTGYLDHKQLAPLLAQADLTVLPSVIPEAYPLSLAESLAVGIPPIAARIGGSAQFLKDISGEMPDGHPDLGVEGDPKHMLEDLISVITAHLSVTDGPVQNARSIAERQFGWEAIAEQMQSAYARILTKHSRKVLS